MIRCWVYHLRPFVIGIVTDWDATCNVTSASFWCHEYNTCPRNFNLDSLRWVLIAWNSSVLAIQIPTSNKFPRHSNMSINHKITRLHTHLTPPRRKRGQILHCVHLQSLAGNWDANSVRYNVLHAQPIARYLRILPTHWYNGICLRLEVYGCWAYAGRTIIFGCLRGTPFNWPIWPGDNSVLTEWSRVVIQSHDPVAWQNTTLQKKNRHTVVGLPHSTLDNVTLFLFCRERQF